MLSTASIVERATPATVTIVTFDAAGDTLEQGSGVVLRSNGIVVTNWHVMQGASRAVVVLASREEYGRVRFVDGDSATDVAVLHIPAIGLPTVPTRVSAPAPGDRVFAIGSPLGLSRTVTDGIVSAVRMVGGRQLIQITAAISPGSSGGAVLDASGKVFALATLYLRGGQQLNFAIPVRYALGMLVSNHQERELAQVFGGGEMPRSLSSRSAGESWPSRTASPRASLVGVYALTQSSRKREVGPEPTDSEVGVLVLASESVGWLVLAPDLHDSTYPGAQAFNVRTMRTNADGQVVLEVGGVTYDGYQTDEGFFLDGQDSTYTYVMRAAPYQLSLSARSGPYQATLRTQYEGNISGLSGSYTDWSGVAAFVTLKDSVFADVLVSNSFGGNTFLTGRALLRTDGSFDVVAYATSERRTRISGHFEAGGVVAGTWTDFRDDGKFVGTFTATRF